MYVNLVNCLNTCHLIIPFHPLHPSPGSTWTWSIVFEYLTSDHPIPSSSSVTRMYVKLVNYLNTFHLILSHPLHPSPGSMWTWSIVWIPVIWSSRLFCFVCLQFVRELSQLFEYLSSDHPIPPFHPSPGSMWTWSIVWIPVIWSSYPIVISRMYVNLVNCLNTSHLILSHPLHPSSGSMWTWSIVWIPVIWSSHLIRFIFLQFVRGRVRELGQLFKYVWSDLPFPSSLSVSRKYENLFNCLKSSNPIPSSPIASSLYVNLVNCFNTSHLIFPSLLLHSSPESTWTWSIVWSLNRSSHPLPLHLSPERTWTWSIVWVLFIWSSYTVFFSCLQFVLNLAAAHLVYGERWCMMNLLS